jgi:hypothetical protein
MRIAPLTACNPPHPYPFASAAAHQAADALVHQLRQRTVLHRDLANDRPIPRQPTKTQPERIFGLFRRDA